MPAFHPASKNFTVKKPSPIQRMAVSVAVNNAAALDNGHVAGRLCRHHIKILPGDRVDVEVSPDLTKARIVYRYLVGEVRRP